jgi:hypothetical protein
MEGDRRVRAAETQKWTASVKTSGATLEKE